MYVAGYKFLMLNNLFMNHWGLQKRETRPKWRQMQNLLNNRLIFGIIEENEEAGYVEFSKSLLIGLSKC